MRMKSFIVTVIAIVAAVSAALQQTSVRVDGQVSAAPFVTLDDVFWEAPWVYAQPGGRRTPLPHIDYSNDVMTGRRSVRLDGGGTGAVRIEPGPCTPADACAPPDCGCFAIDSYWIQVVDSDGSNVGRTHLWAAYGMFKVIPVDLVDGPGDELLIVRVPARSAPPAGHDLKILKLDGAKFVELVEPHRIARNLTGRPPGCVKWRTRLFIDTERAKPRPIVLRREFAAQAGCLLYDDAKDIVSNAKAEETLRYSRGRYELH
jgi:hypothetical protein